MTGSGRREDGAAGPPLRRSSNPDTLDTEVYPARNAQSAFGVLGPERSRRLPRGSFGIGDQCPLFSFFGLRRLSLLLKELRKERSNVYPHFLPQRSR